MLVALKPIYDAVGIERINVCTYQAVSGAGRSAVEELVAARPITRKKLRRVALAMALARLSTCTSVFTALLPSLSIATALLAPPPSSLLCLAVPLRGLPLAPLLGFAAALLAAVPPERMPGDETALATLQKALTTATARSR